MTSDRAGFSANGGKNPTPEILSAWVFRDDPSLLTEEILRVLPAGGGRDSFFGRFGAKFPELREKYRTYCIRNLQLESVWKSLQTLFAGAGIRYCPFKGADLAGRVYPEKTIRPMNDLDVLVHPDDFRRALDLLRADHWQIPYHCKNCHHLPPLHKNGVMLEMHFCLPNFQGDPLDWGELLQTSGVAYRLPLEFNLAMLFTHSRHHEWFNGRQLLLDCGFLIRREGNPDWNKIRSVVEKYRISSPALLFRAFADFFPAEAMPPETFPEETMEIFRGLILETPPLGKRKVVASFQWFSLAWWRDRLRGMRPEVIRIHTGNPRGHYLKLLVGYGTVGFRKLRAFWRFRSYIDDAEIQKRLRDEKKIEELLR